MGHTFCGMPPDYTILVDHCVHPGCAQSPQSAHDSKATQFKPIYLHRVAGERTQE